MGRKYIYAAIAATALAATTFSCSKSSDTAATSAANYLYMSTGVCYAGNGFIPPVVADVGVTLSRLNLGSLNYEIVKDYGDLSDEVVDTFANGIVDGGDGYIYASVENATAIGNRRIDKILKTAFGSRTTWFQNSSVFTTVMKGVARVSDGGILSGGTTTIQRFDSTPTRKEAAPLLAWGQTHAGSCVTNNTLITGIVALPAFTGTTVGKYIYSHAAAGQNDIGLIGMNGSINAASCLANAPGAAALTATATANQGWNATLSANATPTAIVYVATPGGTSTGKLLVAYSSSGINTIGVGGLNNALVMYDVNEPDTLTATINNGQILYHDHAYFFGVTAMGYDAANASLYVATSNSFNATPVGYNIEKFSVNLTTPGATRVPNADMSSFQSANSLNNCVTGMLVGN